MNQKIKTISIIALVSGILFSIIYFASKDKNNNNEMITEELKVEILQQGEGGEVKKNDYVAAHYVGFLEDGTKFDSSLDREKAFVFQIGKGEVIKGWDMGILGMKKGEIRRLTIPSKLAYGEKGAGNGLIPANANLTFIVELVDFYSPEAVEAQE